jgi:hypothetical protein
MNSKILNSRDKKRLAEGLAAEYGVDAGLFQDFVLYQRGSETWACSRQCLELDLGGLNIDSIGILVLRDGRPTIHGIQLFFKTAKMTELTKEDAKVFITGSGAHGKRVIVSYKGIPIDSRQNR